MGGIMGLIEEKSSHVEISAQSALCVSSSVLRSSGIQV
jgi:hypothetical protein